MFNVTSNGDLSIVNKSLIIFSDSSERDFMMIFIVSDDCSICLSLRDFNVFTADRYCGLEINVKFLPDFFVDFNFGGFYVEFANAWHHEDL